MLEAQCFICLATELDDKNWIKVLVLIFTSVFSLFWWQQDYYYDYDYCDYYDYDYDYCDYYDYYDYDY